MINTLVAEIFERIGHPWILDTGVIQPDEDDVEKLLDEAVVKLYDGQVGDRLEVAGLIVEKTSHGYDVFVYVGAYQ